MKKKTKIFPEDVEKIVLMERDANWDGKILRAFFFVVNCYDFYTKGFCPRLGFVLSFFFCLISDKSQVF